jgi:hypothetical protein
MSSGVSPYTANAPRKGEMPSISLWNECDHAAYAALFFNSPCSFANVALDSGEYPLY